MAGNDRPNKIASILKLFTKLYGESIDQIIIKKEDRTIESVLKAKLDQFEKNVGKEDFFPAQEWLSKLEKVGCEICVDTDNGNECIKMDDCKKKFTEMCLCILLELHNTIEEEINSSEAGRIGQTEVLLGVKDQKLVSAILQMISSFGIYPNLALGVGVPFTQRSSFGDLLEKEKDAKNSDEYFLFICIRNLCRIMKDKEIGHIIMNKCLGDIFGALIQIGFKSSGTAKKTENEELQGKLNDEEVTSNGKTEGTKFKELQIVPSICQHQRAWCKAELSNLLDSIYQPIVVKELMILQGFGRPKPTYGVAGVCPPPRWLQRICGKLLSQRLMNKNGVQNVLKAIFDGYSMEGPDALTKCDMIGRLVASCPFQANSLSEYYEQISTQILNMMNLKEIDENVKHLYTRVVSCCISWMLQKESTLTRKLILEKLMQPFLKISKPEIDVASFKMISEKEVGQSVENIHKIFVLGTDPQEHMIKELSMISQPMFELYSFLRNGASYLKPLICEILLRLLQNSSSEMRNETFLFLLTGGVTKDNNNAKMIMNSSLKFENGSCGGAYVTRCTTNEESDELGLGTDVSTEQRIIAALDLLTMVKDPKIAGYLFVFLLEKVTKILSEGTTGLQAEDLSDIDRVIKTLKYHIPIVSMIAAMCDQYGNDVIKEPKHVISFIKVSLQCCCVVNKDGGDIVSDDAFKSETLQMALTILSMIVGSAKEDDQNDFQELQELAPVLQKIEGTTSMTSIRKTANDLRVSILTHGAVESHTSGGAEDGKGQNMDLDSDQAFDIAMKELTSPLIPTRGHALLQLSLLLENRNSKAIKCNEKLLSVFMDNLSHDDTYIYLAAVRGLVSVANIHHKTVIPHLAKEFAMFSDTPKENVKYQGLYFKGDTNKPSRKSYSPEMRMKIGEAILKSLRACGPVLPRYSQIVLASLLAGVRDMDGDVRASSFSNIGDVCKLLRFTVGPVIHELMNCITSVLQTEKETNVKRAALLVIKMLLEGLGKDTIQVIGSVLKEIYNQLKIVVNYEKDEVTLNYAVVGLTELDAIMKNYLFPQQDFKKKIHVLNPPE